MRVFLPLRAVPPFPWQCPSSTTPYAVRTARQPSAVITASRPPARSNAPLTSSTTGGGRGKGQETAAFTSSAIFFSTTALHFWSAYATGHMSPSSRLAASWKPRVE